MDKPTEARLREIAEVLGALHEEVRNWEVSDFEWLSTRLRYAQEESRFMISMRFNPRAPQGGSPQGVKRD